MKSKMDALPPVSEMMRDAGLEPKKALGQNFLFDLNLTGKIAKSVPDIENQTILEVGPGPAGLTRALLSAGAKNVIAIEKDKTTAPILDKIIDASNGRLDVIYADALKVFDKKNSHSEFSLPDTFAICANLPYNVGTELLIRWLHMMPRPVTSMTLMFQREVAMRIVAAPGTDAYGRLSVLASLVSIPKMLFTVPRTAFTPPPKVTSAIVQILPREHDISPELLSRIEALTARLFGNRRKMIRSIIRDIDWTRFGLTGMERAEELSPEKFRKIASANVI